MMYPIHSMYANLQSKIFTAWSLQPTYCNFSYYMYLSASRPNVEGDLAVLALPPIQANLKSTCSMRFYYHMIGNHVGQLNIYKRNHVSFCL